MKNQLLPRKRLVGCLTVLTLVLLCRCAVAQVSDPEAEQEIKILQGRVELFFTKLTDSAIGAEGAVREIVGQGPLKNRNDDINKLIEQAVALDQRYGVYAGHEAVAQRAVGKDLIFLRYLYKGEKFPVVWYFTFYRTGTNGSINRDWQLIAVRFDSKVEALDK